MPISAWIMLIVGFGVLFGGIGFCIYKAYIANKH
ncbi:MetS family NSS transporter small subunit [candidate division WOR-3 bacterium]|nr:MetS family NSS transporter small subunit [candidate division WOR-3 bacterium]